MRHLKKINNIYTREFLQFDSVSGTCSRTEVDSFFPTLYIELTYIVGILINHQFGYMGILYRVQIPSNDIKGDFYISVRQ